MHNSKICFTFVNSKQNGHFAPIFNDYGNIDMMNGLDEEQHRRLAEDFKQLKCRALMVIGKTPLTESLYGEYIKDEYYKNYSVNIRNRFKNDKMHIVVKNY